MRRLRQSLVDRYPPELTQTIQGRLTRQNRSKRLSFNMIGGFLLSLP
jgi:hypothetical protein